MDLDELDDTAVTVWVARVNVPDGDTIVTAWSIRGKSEQWCAHELDVETDAITWRDTEASLPGITVGWHLEGDMVASITQVEVRDPIELSRQYPLNMPAAQHVFDYDYE